MRSIILFICLLPMLGYGQNPFSNYIAANAGGTINTEYVEMFPMVLPDGLTLYFSSNRPGGQGDLDIYVCTRKSHGDAWSEPKNLGTNINTNASDHSVTISDDGHWMIFTSEKDGGFGTGAFTFHIGKTYQTLLDGKKPKMQVEKLIVQLMMDVLTITGANKEPLSISPVTEKAENKNSIYMSVNLKKVSSPFPF